MQNHNLRNIQIVDRLALDVNRCAVRQKQSVKVDRATPLSDNIGYSNL